MQPGDFRRYRGGIAKFQLPASWVEQYDPLGGGTFYEPGDDTGTLRINVLDFERQQGGTDSIPTAFDLLTLTRSVDETEALPNGAAVARYVTHAEESGEDLRIHNWQIGVCVSATHFRIVVLLTRLLTDKSKSQTCRRSCDCWTR